MKSIRRRRNGYALLFAASICLAVWLGMAFMLEAVFALGAISLISVLVRQSRLLYDKHSFGIIASLRRPLLFQRRQP